LPDPQEFDERTHEWTFTRTYPLPEICRYFHVTKRIDRASPVGNSD
jgi:hypothetical protein